MHGGCNIIALFSLDSPRPFSLHLQYFAATPWRMPGGGLVVCVSWIGLPNSFCAGDSTSLRDGVLWYCSRALASLSSSREWLFHDVWINFFIDFTVDSIFPLLWGYLGEDTLC